MSSSRVRKTPPTICAKKRAVFQCSHIKLGAGRHCSRVFTRKGNMKRHEKDLHTDLFVIISSSSDGTASSNRQPHHDVHLRQQRSQGTISDINPLMVDRATFAEEPRLTNGEHVPGQSQQGPGLTEPSLIQRGKFSLTLLIHFLIRPLVAVTFRRKTLNLSCQMKPTTWTIRNGHPRTGRVYQAL